MSQATASRAKSACLRHVPRGNTCRGVNRAIVRWLLKSDAAHDGAQWLDLPCGDGSLMRALRRCFPGTIVRGADVADVPDLGPDEFALVDASRPFQLFAGIRFDAIFSVSGVPEFDNTLQFFEQCRHHLRPGGRLLVTNDNILTVRDRLAYFWHGCFRQFPAYAGAEARSWKIVPVHNLTRILEDAGFEIEEVRYVSLKGKDLFLLPLALLIHPVQALWRVWHKRLKVPPVWRRRLHPFRALFYRHYLVICRKPAVEGSEETPGGGAGNGSPRS